MYNKQKDTFSFIGEEKTRVRRNDAGLREFRRKGKNTRLMREREREKNTRLMRVERGREKKT